MAGIFVTDTGFQRKVLAEIKLEREDEYKQRFGNDIDLDPESTFGQIIALESEREEQLWLLMEELYSIRDPDKATGNSLTALARETGTVRKAATESQVDNVILYTSSPSGPIVVVPSGSKVRRTDGFDEDPTAPALFTSQHTISISENFAKDAQFTPENITTGSTHRVEFKSVTYQYIALVSDDADDVVDGLIIAINNLDPLITVSNIGGILRIFSSTSPFQATDVQNMDYTVLGSSGDDSVGTGFFIADDAGEISVPANSLTVISTPVASWSSLNNPLAGLTGTEEESDPALRIRRIDELVKGLATETAIRAAILNVESVVRSTVSSNRTLFTDADGLPPKSFEAVVEGGADLDVGQAVWDSQPAGIESFGNTSVTATDSEGRTQAVEFSRPEPVYIHVRVTRTDNTEETYPANGDDQIKEAIVAWSEDTENIDLGKDVIRQRLADPVYSVPGTGDITIEIDGTPNPGDSPIFAQQNITIGVREIAEFATTRITVVTV